MNRIKAKEILKNAFEGVKASTHSEILEKLIFQNSSDNESKYKEILFEVLEMLHEGNFESVSKQLSEKKVFWDHPLLEDVAFQEREKYAFIEKPFQVEEGVLKCPKCGSMKSYSYSKQTRSADEPMTTFATCMGCKHRWTYSG